MERRAFAKLRPALGFTCTWLTPRSWYSTGSSTVMRLRSGELSAFIVAYSVVDSPSRSARHENGPVSLSVGESVAFLDRRQEAELGEVQGRARLVEYSKDNLLTVHRRSVATRRSISRRPAVRVMRPSWGTRCSAMSRLAMT